MTFNAPGEGGLPRPGRLDSLTQVHGVAPIIFVFSVGNAAGDVDKIMPYKIRVIDAWAVKTATGGASDTVQVKNGATAITDALDLNVADKVVVRAGTIDDASRDVAAGGTLRVTSVDGSNPSSEVFVAAILVP